MTKADILPPVDARLSRYSVCHRPTETLEQTKTRNRKSQKSQPKTVYQCLGKLYGHVIVKL